jgi:hypothetical protein
MRDKADIRQRYEFISSRPSSVRGSQAGPCRLLAQPSSILVPLDGRAALNIRIKPNNISREQPAQQAQVSLKGGRGGWGSPGLHKRVSVVRIFGRSARKVEEIRRRSPQHSSGY